jgi:hypothetical protein
VNIFLLLQGYSSFYNANLTNSYANSGYPGYGQSSYISYPPTSFGMASSSGCDVEASALGYGGLSVETSAAMKSDLR